MSSCKEELKVRLLYKGTWMITDFFNDHMYLLEGSREALLIDTGIGSLTLPEWIRELTHKPLRVALSHGHADHIGTTGICEHSAVPQVFLSPQDFTLYREHAMPEYKRTYCEKKFQRYGTNLTMLQKKEYLDRLTALRPCKRLSPIPDCFELGHRTVRVIPTPGHTPGSVCFLDEETRILFSGDTVCDLCVLLNFKHSAPPEVFLSSLKRLKQYPIHRIYCGHHRGQVDARAVDRYLSLCRHILSVPEDKRKKQYHYSEIMPQKKQEENLHLSICLPPSAALV